MVPGQIVWLIYNFLELMRVPLPANQFLAMILICQAACRDTESIITYATLYRGLHTTSQVTANNGRL